MSTEMLDLILIEEGYAFFLSHVILIKWWNEGASWENNLSVDVNTIASAGKHCVISSTWKILHQIAPTSALLKTKYITSWQQTSVLSFSGTICSIKLQELYGNN